MPPDELTEELNKQALTIRIKDGKVEVLSIHETNKDDQIEALTKKLAETERKLEDSKSSFRYICGKNHSLENELMAEWDRIAALMKTIEAFDPDKAQYLPKTPQAIARKIMSEMKVTHSCLKDSETGHESDQILTIRYGQDSVTFPLPITGLENLKWQVREYKEMANKMAKVVCERGQTIQALQEALSQKRKRIKLLQGRVSEWARESESQHLKAVAGIGTRGEKS